MSILHSTMVKTPNPVRAIVAPHPLDTSDFCKGNYFLATPLPTNQRHIVQGVSERGKDEVVFHDHGQRGTVCWCCSKCILSEETVLSIRSIYHQI